MTEPAAGTTNTAESGATVGIQGETVINSTAYIVQPGASPQEKYTVGVRYLEDGVPGKARELTSDAIAHGHDSGEVRFHWVLAMLSKRSYRDLSAEDRERLACLPDVLSTYVDDEWRRALETICALLDRLRDPGMDPGPALDELDALPPQQHDMIVRHLDHVLTGGMKDSLWAAICQAADESRLNEDRLKRAWAYFHPTPALPKVRVPADDATTLGERLRAFVWSGVFVTALCRLGWSVLVDGAPLPMLALLLALTAGYTGTRTGLEWYRRTARLAVKDHAYATERGSNRAPEAGFAKRVDHSFRHYAHKYAPQGEDRERWFAETAGIRNTLRDDITELYRGDRIRVEAVNWLIRHHIVDIRKRWNNGTLHDYREQYRTALATRVWCSLSFAALVPSALSVVSTAVRIEPFPSVLAISVALVSGWGASTCWLRILRERCRFAEEEREHHQLKAERNAAYQRWKGKLEATRPSESEMETWLDCDRKLFLHDVLRNYRLTWTDIIVYTFLQGPAGYYTRARVTGGPWRYSRYNLRLFLITQDGVREVGTELDFQQASCNGQERTNFRFDAVSSVQVTVDGESSYSLELTLMNGPTRNIRVIDAAPDSEENPTEISKLSLDAAGFTHTLHILEGIAAEGKNWISRDRITTRS